MAERTTYLLLPLSHHDEYGVGPICAVLPIAPSTYYERKAREVDYTRRPTREDSDNQLGEEVRCVTQAKHSSENRGGSKEGGQPVRDRIDKAARRWCGAALGVGAQSLPKRLQYPA